MLRGARVSANFLEILGVRPERGRSFLATEDAPGGPPVAMISAALWKRRFGATASIDGQMATLDSVPHTIVGVLPEGFRFPFPDVDVWLTQPSQTPSLAPQFRACCVALFGFGRLKPGVSLEQARAELEVLSAQHEAARSGALDRGPLRATPLKDELATNVSSMLWMLLAAVGFVLLIACANVATLLMARATSRERELAVRTALGAPRGRLVRQLLTESLVLSVAGGALGLLVAATTVGLFTPVRDVRSASRGRSPSQRNRAGVYDRGVGGGGPCVWHRCPRCRSCGPVLWKVFARAGQPARTAARSQGGFA